MFAFSRTSCAFLLGVLVVGSTLLPRLAGQSRDVCTDAGARQAWENQSSPVYADATKLAHTLSNRGFIVDCVRRSKEEHLFTGQKGAAWFKTDKGIFEVWFLPKTESFAGLEVIEEARGNGRYVYSFRGAPRISTHMDSSKQIFFLKQENLLFEVWGDGNWRQASASRFKSHEIRNPPDTRRIHLSIQCHLLSGEGALGRERRLSLLPQVAHQNPSSLVSFTPIKPWSEIYTRS